MAKQKTHDTKVYKDLQEKYNLLSQLMDQIPDVIYFKDRKGRLIMVNEAHARGLGLKPDQVIGKTDKDIFGKERATSMQRDDEHVIRTGKPIIDKVERSTRADGVDNYVSTTKIPRYDARGRVIGLIGITRDITNRMQLEHLRTEKKHMEAQLISLQELNKMKSEFISVVSHELRTPLAVIKEAVNLIKEGTMGPVTDKQDRMLATALAKVSALQNLINDLLDVSRIEKNTMELHYSLVNLSDLLTDSAQFFRKWAEEKGITLNYSIPDQEINMFLDADRINQVVANLINNAIKFTEQNGDILIEVRHLRDTVRIGVCDTGIGIAKENIPKLFQKFVQARGLTDANRKGLGLGLSICREIIEKHHGEIWVESKLGVGSKFYFIIPRIYELKALNKESKDRLNAMLAQHDTLYLIELSMVKFRQFRKRIKTQVKDLFADLRSIMEDCFKEADGDKKAAPQILSLDDRNGVFSIIYPRATEKKADKLCASIKKRVNKYFESIKLENVFINVGVLSFPEGEGHLTTQQLLETLFVKKVYVGAEIRKFRRIRHETALELIYPDDRTERCQTIDISEGGICALTKTPLRINDKIMIRLEIPPYKKPVYSRARIAWLQPVEGLSSGKDPQYRIGLEFIRLPAREKKVLTALLKSMAM
ncbi:MAG: ATP-binding protein [Candidatus Omnitrophota bacterium]